MENILLSIVGPTAIGKTSLAIALANHYNTEILSADSRQFYKEMSIGTAIPSADELRAATHHFIQHKSIEETYTVGDFEREAIGLLEQLYKKKKIAILVGGSGLYTDAITKGLDEFPKLDPQIRLSLVAQYDKNGISYLQDQLKQRDPLYYQTVDKDNPHRLIRALEVCIGSGKAYSSFLKKEKKPRPFKTLTIGLRAERELLYERINERVDAMIADGLLEQAKSLYKDRELNALQTVGYKELFLYFDGDCELSFAIDEIKKNTRRFAKRQMTWFKKDTSILWVDYKNPVTNTLASIEEWILNNRE